LDLKLNHLHWILSLYLINFACVAFSAEWILVVSWVLCSVLHFASGLCYCKLTIYDQTKTWLWKYRDSRLSV